MQINNVNRQSFKSLYIEKNLIKKIQNGAKTAKFSSDFSIIKNSILANKLDNKKFVDVFLKENNNEFYAIISSKAEGIPINPRNKLQIETTKKGLSKLKKWVNEWNHAYNPKTIEQFKKLEKLIKNTDWQGSSLDKALKALYE